MAARAMTRRSFLARMSTGGSLFLLAACAPKSSGPTPAQPTAAPAQPTAAPVATQKPAVPTPVPAAELRGEIVSVHHSNAAAWDSGTLKPIAEAFNKVFPNVTLTGIGTSADTEFTQKVTTMVAGGTPPDLMWLSPNRLGALAPKGVFEELQPRVDASPLMQRIWKGIPTELGKFKGKQYGTPSDRFIRLFFYNADMFEKAGLKPPTDDWTWDDLVQYGLKLTNAKENLYLFTPDVSSAEPASQWVWANGGTMFSNDCVRVNFDQDANIGAMQYLADLFIKHKVAPSPELKLGDIGVSFPTGQLAMVQGNAGMLAGQLGPKASWAFKWGIVYQPKGPKSQDGIVRANYQAIGKGAKNAQLAWRFIEWYLDDELQTTLSQGLNPSPRQDIIEKVFLPLLPEHLHATIERSNQVGRPTELCPAWDIAQKIYREEMAAVWLGLISTREGMMSCYKKAQPELESLMKELGLA